MEERTLILPDGHPLFFRVWNTENAKATLVEILRKKPSDAKGDFVVSVSLSTTMGPGVRVNYRDMADAAAV